MIREHVFGRIESLEPQAPAKYRVKISYAVEIAGSELTQFLNVAFGNSSLKAGIRVEAVELPELLMRHFRGPRFGRQGLRDYLGVPRRPILCTALKPLGLSAEGLAQLAYQFALGGVDIIKDDHGLADQPFAPFEERVRLCSAAVRRANDETGGRSVYMPNVTARHPDILNRARFARQQGAGALLIAPGLTGLDAVRMLADDPGVQLPVFFHPALLGSHAIHPDHGLAPAFLFGQLPRLAGADAVIFPNYGGRFAFTEKDCREIMRGTQMDMGFIKPIFPSPGGGLSFDRIPEMLALYGQEAVFLIGGDFFSRGPDLAANCRYFREMIEKTA
jgi:ribulose-bisphosphate carboxylase large chain